MYITRTALDNITFDSEGVLLDATRIPGSAIGAGVQITKHELGPTPFATVTLTLYTEQVSVDGSAKGAFTINHV